MEWFTKALVRFPGPDFGDGLTTASTSPPDYDLILKQHHAYLLTLRSLGLAVTVLPSLPGLPDAHFIEDAAVHTPEVNILTRPGAPSRRAEPDHLKAPLGRLGPLQQIRPPGTLDGGDVLFVERTCFIGISDRTNIHGAQQLVGILSPYGYTCLPIAVEEGLHLKSSINYLGQNTLLVTKNWENHTTLSGYRLIVVPYEESYAANTLWVNEHFLVPAGFPRTRALLRKLNQPIIELQMSEAQKMDGGLSCWSLRLQPQAQKKRRQRAD